jgi:hypothetical protein
VLALAVGLILALTGPLSAADKDAAEVKETAVAFLKALKAKDVDAVMKVSAVTFLYNDDDKRGDIAVTKDAGVLKKWFKKHLDADDTDAVPTEVARVSRFGQVMGRIESEEVRKTVEDVVGKDGFVVFVTADEGTSVILIRIKGGRAVVVGVEGAGGGV